MDHSEQTLAKKAPPQRPGARIGITGLAAIVFVVAFAAGFHKFAAVDRNGESSSTKLSSKRDETVVLLIARKDLDGYLIIKKPEELFEEKEVPAPNSPRRFLTKFDEVKGRQLRFRVRAGEMITEDDLYNGFHLPGHRAVGIQLSQEQKPSDFVPGSRADIACSLRSDTGEDRGTRIFLRNVFVSSIAQRVACPIDNGPAPLAEVVTVALTPEDCLKLETAKGKGKINLIPLP